MKFKFSSLLIASALFSAMALPAQANNNAMLELLKVLRDKGTISAQDYQLLVSAAKTDKDSIEAIDTKAEKVSGSNVKITTKGKLKVESADGNWSFQPIGRVQWDAISADADTGNSDDDVKGTELRRARLGFQGEIYNWGYKFEVDFADGDASIKDAYIGYGTKVGDIKTGIKLGQSHIPFGLNTKISSKYMSFIDRPFFADSSVSPARASGAVVALADKDHKWTLSTGLQNGEFDVNGGDTNEINGSTFAVRGSFVPYMKDKNHLVQIGAAFLTQGGGDDFTFRPDLVSHDDIFRPVSTGTIASTVFDGANAFTIDTLAVYGSFHAMAEYLNHTAEQDIASDIDTTAFAIEAGYLLTGESLKWQKGYTSGITPNSKYGAWQVAARFETIEIDPGSSLEDEFDKFTLGINYYPTQNTRLMLNYDQATDLTVNGSTVNDEPSALKFRAQAYW